MHIPCKLKPPALPIIKQMVMAAQLVPLLLSAQALLLYLLLLPILLLLLLQRRHYFASGQAAAVHGERAPPSPPSKLPLVGHMHLIGSDPHVSLAALAAKHGESGLMLLRLGQVLNLVVSTPDAAEAVLRTHDHVFASRPHNAFVDTLLGGNVDVAFAPYGEFWRQTRRLVTTHLLSARKVLSLRHGREEEVRLVMAKIRDAPGGAAVDMTRLLSAYTNDIACRAVSGKFFREEGRNELFREVIDGNVAAFGGFNPQDYFPSLAKVDVLARVLFPKMHRLRKRWDGLLDRIIDDHASKTASLQRQHGEQDDQEADFVDVLLSRQHEYSLTRQHIKAILIDMFVAGTDTSYVVLEFAMAKLMRKPHLMAKLQAEVRDKTPKGQQMVTEDDLGGMSYLKAVLKETVRLHPPLPLLLPHLSVEKCVINGLTIPAETRVIINVWAIGRDTGSWEDADKFIPERFEDTGTPDFKGRDFQLLPFGGGRRICPGINFGMASVEIMLANLVYCFDWETPCGMRHEDIDMTDVFGMTVHRKQKLLLIPRPRDDMFVPGTNMSYVFLEFAMAELMQKPHLMAKLQTEVMDKTPMDQQMVTEDDLGSMPFLKALLKETVWLHPPLPLLLPHLSVEKCVINGLMIPIGTRVIINVWAISRDTGSSEDADKFIPERFEDISAPDFKGRDFQLLPFGGGQRICPGINFGMSSVEIMLANLVCCFDWEPPGGMRHEDIDMTDVFGMTVHQKHKLLIVPRS